MTIMLLVAVIFHGAETTRTALWGVPPAAPTSSSWRREVPVTPTLPSRQLDGLWRVEDQRCCQCQARCHRGSGGLSGDSNFNHYRNAILLRHENQQSFPCCCIDDNAGIIRSNHSGNIDDCMNARCAVVTINVVHAMLWTIFLVWMIVALRVEHYLQAKASQATDSYWHNQYNNQYNQFTTNPNQQANAGNNRFLAQEIDGQDDGSWSSSLSSWSQSWYDYWYGNTDDTLMSNMTTALSGNEVYESGGSSSSSTSSSSSSSTWSSYWKQYFGDSVQYNTSGTLDDDDSSNTFTWLDSWNDYWLSLSTHGAGPTSNKSDETTTRHAQRSMPMWYTIAAFKILCSISGVMGAVYYNPYLIGAATISWGASLLQSALQRHVVAILVSSLCLYPHVILIRRIQKQRQEQERGTSSCMLHKQ